MSRVKAAASERKWLLCIRLDKQNKNEWKELDFLREQDWLPTNLQNKNAVPVPSNICIGWLNFAFWYLDLGDAVYRLNILLANTPLYIEYSLNVIEP